MTLARPTFKGRLDECLDFIVERAGGFIDEEDVGVGAGHVEWPLEMEADVQGSLIPAVRESTQVKADQDVLWDAGYVWSWGG